MSHAQGDRDEPHALARGALAIRGAFVPLPAAAPQRLAVTSMKRCSTRSRGVSHALLEVPAEERQRLDRDGGLMSSSR